MSHPYNVAREEGAPIENTPCKRISLEENIVIESRELPLRRGFLSLRMASVMEQSQFMKKRSYIIVLLLLLVGSSGPGWSQNTQNRSAIKCAEDSPERRGEEGCTILASRPIVGTLPRNVYWHIDRFTSLETAKKAAGLNAAAAEAHGGVWLMTVEGKTRDHHGGRHVAMIGPLSLPASEGYTMRVVSSLLKRGASTPVHIHSGPEVWYIVAGEQCLETQNASHRLKAGNSFVLASDQIHRGRIHSAEMRGALALVLHDTKRPASRDLTDPPPLKACRQAK